MGVMIDIATAYNRCLCTNKGAKDMVYNYSVLHKYLQVMVSTKLFVHVSVGPKGSNSVMFV